ncbi:MAG: helix-turn-helix transcriptional regulator [Bacilli bacterium]|nr:helix-turn-helix transcriptional regulator [Bacilli bacterium]
MRSDLIEFRHRLGLTQEEFAKLFKKNKQYQNNVEKGKRKGSAEYWLLIQKKFKLTNETTLDLMEVTSNENT